MTSPCISCHASPSAEAAHNTDCACPAMPAGACDDCRQISWLYDCSPEIAWPSQWLCRDCMHAAERRAETERDELEALA